MPELPGLQSSERDVVARLEAATSIAIFCDFDGTFSIQDVGSTLARTYLSDLRLDLWAAFERGEFQPWQYNMELLDGFHLPPAKLHAFLETVELDPGARRLIEWCRKAGASFRILSDGFDYNLDRLQAINDVRFDYASNHLEYEGDVWRISPGAPNPACGCGTGTCKRGIIEAEREKHPGCFCIHVGNGQVSDLCGALAADLAFAKDSLATALQERGVAHLQFDTLLDVEAKLDQLLAEAGKAGA